MKGMALGLVQKAIVWSARCRVSALIWLASGAVFTSVMLGIGRLSSYPVPRPMAELWFSAVCAAVAAGAAVAVIVRVRRDSVDSRYLMVLVLAVSVAMMVADFVRIATARTDGANFGIGLFLLGPTALTFVGLLSLLLVVAAGLVSPETARQWLRRPLTVPAVMALPSLGLTMMLVFSFPSTVVDTDFYLLRDILGGIWESLWGPLLSDRVAAFSVFWSMGVLMVVAPMVLRSVYRSGSRNAPVLVVAVWMILALAGEGAVYVMVPALVWVAANLVVAKGGRRTPASS